MIEKSNDFRRIRAVACALGKGEVESSILSCSTIKPNKINTVKAFAAYVYRAGLCVNRTGTAARNWQGEIALSLYPEYDDLICDDGNRYSSPTVLYRYFDAAGDLLYVGIAKDFEYRDQQHMVQAAWRAGAVCVRMELFPNRRMAECAENYAIAHERPPHNVKCMPPHHPGTIHEWYIQKMGGLRGELVRWAKLGQWVREYPSICEAPDWWSDDRLPPVPYAGKPAKAKTAKRARQTDDDELANIDWRR